MPVFEDVLRRLRLLTPPPGDQAPISSMLDDFDRALAAARRAADAAGAGDQEAFDRALEEATEFAKRGDDRSKRYRFRDCREG